MDAQIKRARYLFSKEFNVLFAQTVQGFPSIWNRSLLENRSLTVIDIAWEKIAKILGNGLTAKQCQQKWRTMRNQYTAHLRKGARNGTNIPFLNGAMDFVRPFTTSGLGYHGGNCYEDEPEITISTTSGYGVDPLSNEYDDAPAACQHVQIDSSDGDALFLLSVLPEMEAMNEEQKQTFKDTVQTLVERFLD